MTREEAKEVFINRGFVNVKGGIIFDGDKWRQSVQIITEWLKEQLCEDAISRQAVLEYIEGSYAELGHSTENELVCQDIKELPPVTPQPKTGKWITEKVGEGHKVYCSECKESAVFEYVHDGDIYSSCGHGVVKKTKYCPNCGTKMEVDV